MLLLLLLLLLLLSLLLSLPYEDDNINNTIKPGVLTCLLRCGVQVLRQERDHAFGVVGLLRAV